MSTLGSFTGALDSVASGNPLGGIAKSAADSVAGFGLGQISSYVLDGTKAALQEVASMIGAATAPNLQSTWFSSTYWRVAALAAMLTLPFLFAAAVQALARSDLALLGKAVFGYLPLSLLGVSLAAPLTMLLLAATDQMSAAVSATATNSGAEFLDKAALAAGGVSLAQGSPFFAVVIGLFAVMAALALAVELLIRAAAVYVVVLMLPLAFAAMVWPARRILAVRMVELLVSLILAKFVIVAVLSLAGAAFQGGHPGLSELLTAMALLLLSTLAPWTLMRILPFTELAAGAGGMIRQELPHPRELASSATSSSSGATESAMELPARMRSQAHQTDTGFGGGSYGDGFGGGSNGGGFAGGSNAAGPASTAPDGPASPQTTGAAQAQTAGAAGTPTADPTEPQPASPAADARPPYVPPELWLREEPVRFGDGFPAGPFDQPQPRDPEDSE